jgi:hypothetical protein
MKVNGQFHAPAALLPEKKHSLDRVAPRGSLDAVAKIKFSAPCQKLNPDRVARSLVTLLTDLSHMPWLVLNMTEMGTSRGSLTGADCTYFPNALFAFLHTVTY